MSTHDQPAVAAPPLLADPVLSREVELFLYHDALLLDEWRLREWFALFTPDCEYLVPATDRPDSGTAWTESPHSTTKRIISNVMASPNPDGSITALANFVVYRSALAKLDVYPGSYRMRLLRGGTAGFEIQSRRSTLALAQLRPQGRVSVIL
jgi:p-cumate 2,3-dioxygenase subunit beta